MKVEPFIKHCEDVWWDGDDPLQHSYHLETSLLEACFFSNQSLHEIPFFFCQDMKIKWRTTKNHLGKDIHELFRASFSGSPAATSLVSRARENIIVWAFISGAGAWVVIGVKTFFLLKWMTTLTIIIEGVCFTFFLAERKSCPPNFTRVMALTIILLETELSGAKSLLTYPITFPPLPPPTTGDRDPRVNSRQQALLKLFLLFQLFTKIKQN